MLAAKSLIRRATRITSLTTYHGSSSPSTAAAVMMMGVNNTHAVLRRGYHDNIIEHYENPRNVGSLDKNDDNVGTVRDNDYIN
jgi:nitrogen fixation NifU-like protein